MKLFMLPLAGAAAKTLVPDAHPHLVAQFAKDGALTPGDFEAAAAIPWKKKAARARARVSHGDFTGYYGMRIPENTVRDGVALWQGNHAWHAEGRACTVRGAGRVVGGVWRLWAVGVWCVRVRPGGCCAPRVAPGVAVSPGKFFFEQAR